MSRSAQCVCGGGRGGIRLLRGGGAWGRGGGGVCSGFGCWGEGGEDGGRGGLL